MRLRISVLLAIAALTVASDQSRAATPTLMTLVNFNGANGAGPLAGLIADANGNLFGTTEGGGVGTYIYGSVFEITKTAGGYASTPTTLVGFNGANGAFPYTANLLADGNGNLFGTTIQGWAYGLGTVFEITRTASGYASTPTTLVSFNGANGAEPAAGLIIDADGNLFGTTTRGGNLTDCPSILPPGCGTVFEITKTAGGYASTPTVLYSFCAQANCADGRDPIAGLIADANGNLFGTTTGGGVSNNCGNCGTVFEIAKTAGGYASTPTTLVNFNGTDGTNAFASLIIDADGNLFSTTQTGGAYDYGTVFEIAKIGRGYASTPTTLISFDGTNGRYPGASLLADGNGSLFGTTEGLSAVGSNIYGTVFEIAKTAGGYASTPTTLISFNGTDGAVPEAGLIADANGNLFSTTAGGGAYGHGTVFEITGSGFVPPAQFAGTPGKPNCYGQSVSALAKQYGGLNAAAAALGYPSVRALQEAIQEFCEA